MAQIEVVGAAVAEEGREEPYVSLVVPVFNEEASLDEVYRQSVAALDSLGRPYELIFVDDGSTDRTWAAIERLHDADGHVRAVRFKRNFGQHPAMHAAIVRARGEIVVTMDGDLQNVPADLVKLVRAIEDGADVASGRRNSRSDPWRRTFSSRIVNKLLRAFTKADVDDFGCAFNGYRRDALLPVASSIGKQKFTKALVLSTGATVVQVDVGHRPREGRSRYSSLRLLRLALHVIAGFWPQPIQWAGVIVGVTTTLASIAVTAWAAVIWIARADFPGPLFLGALVLMILGIQGFILAFVGEYLGRVQRDIEGRPLYAVDRELGARDS